MKLNLTRPIVFFDLETTGLDIVNDRIVEICLLKVEPNGNEQAITWRLNPEMHIPEQASAVHGIYDEDVKGCPTFGQKAKEQEEILRDCDLAGYNSNKFDIPMLVEEFLRADIDIDMKGRQCIDVQNIFHKKEQRTLVAAYKFYCGKDLENAHSAEADIRATYEVLKGELDKYDDLENDVKALAEYSRMGNPTVDFACRLVYDEEGNEVVNFGKYKGMKVSDVFQRDPGYYGWIMQADFSRNTKQVFKQLYLKYRAK